MMIDKPNDNTVQSESNSAQVLVEERERLRNWLAKSAESKRVCYVQTQDKDYLAAAEALDWAAREILMQSV